MSLAELTDRQAVLSALAECDRIGRETFLEKYGFHAARTYFLRHQGRLYPSKAVAGVAHGYQFPERGPLVWSEFSGGDATVKKKLVSLGFEVVRRSESVKGVRVFGEIPGFPPGSWFSTRRELSVSGVHRPHQAGISGSLGEGADSVMVSGGYEDDEDYGDLIIYTGHGGNDPGTRKQVADQELERGNRALARSSDLGLPVRVVRGARGKPTFSPQSGYRYDGLYHVERYWHEQGRSGFRVWRFRLLRVDGVSLPEAAALGAPARVSANVQRIVRNTAVSQAVKELHEYRCQVCGVVVETLAGPYAEAAHIRPLGRPHDGPDVVGNVLCLCPNDHVRFDSGAIHLTADLHVVETLTGTLLGQLRVVTGHGVNAKYVSYHREVHCS